MADIKGDIGDRDEELRTVMFLLGAIADQEPNISNGRITLNSKQLDDMSVTLGWGIKTSTSPDGTEFYIDKVSAEDLEQQHEDDVQKAVADHEERIAAEADD